MTDWESINNKRQAVYRAIERLRSAAEAVEMSDTKLANDCRAAADDLRDNFRRELQVLAIAGMRGVNQ